MKERSFLLIIVVIFFSAHNMTAMAEKAVLGHIEKDEDVQVEQLLDKEGLDPNCRFTSNRTMLHETVSYDAPKTMELLLNRGINPNVPDNHGICPLHLVASYEDRPEVADLLLACKLLVIDPRNGHGETPLHFAVNLCNYPMIKRLMEKGASPEICDNDGQNASDKARGVSTMLGLLYSKKDKA